MKLKMTKSLFTVLLSIFFIVFYNFTFYQKTLAIYPLNSHNFLFLFSLTSVLILATNLFINIVLLIINLIAKTVRLNTIYKRFLSVVIFLAMTGAYVMDSFGVVIDDNMFLNIIKTDAKETLDLITPKLFLYFVFLFLLPIFIIIKTKFEKIEFKKEFIQYLKSILISIVLVFLMILPFGKFYASFLRENKPLRYYTNPTYWMYSMGKFGSSFAKNPNKTMQSLGLDAVISKHDKDRELIILVVGETARRDKFSLNGNTNDTNPLLKKENVISFKNVTSCGTSTAISVPCMFSHYTRSNFSFDAANYTHNLLDVLSHTKSVNILWRDNNSDSKGVAVRFKYEDYKSSPPNTVCDAECRDEGMLVGLQEHIDNVKENDIVIVLHQMGNHGPAYFKRYPKKFEVFKPVCLTSELAKCTNEEITNTYDNAILYTDYFLSKVIALLKNNSTHFSTAMLYASDHGESLGENGVYLHGLPYMMAPKEQVDVPLIMWFGGKMELETDYVSLKKLINEPYSHDNIFHTVLGMLEVESSVYDPKLDILHGIHFQNKK